MPTPGEEYDMPVAYGEDHPDFMRIDHAQLAEGAAGHLGVRRQQPPTEAETSTISSSVLRHTFPTGPREERALKDLAFFGGCHLNALLPPWYSRLSAAARLVALLKAECAAGETPQVRPVAVGGIETRLPLLRDSS
jgi:hypothetical protein